MSWQACAWADSLDYDIVNALAFRVLIKLANVSNDTGTIAFRSKSEMALELGVSERSIQRALKDLQIQRLITPGDQHFVGHLRADKRPTVYELNFRYKTQFAQPELPWDASQSGETELSTGDERGDNPGSSGETTVVAHRTIIKRSTTKTYPGDHRASVSPLARCVGTKPHQWPDDEDDSACLRCGLLRYQALVYA